MNSFSAHSRFNILAKLQNTEFDLIIIGGGITGAGCALDAALRGLNVLLLEKNDFASGTSSRSTKLIHGGLRYLKQFEFGLVREVGKERAIAYRNAPHLVRPEPMLLPVIEGGSLSKNATSLGLWMYEWLAGVKSSERRKMLSAQACLKREPLLDASIVKGGAIYTEYRTDDARLTISVLKTAVEKGAIALNYVSVNQLLKDNGKVFGIEATDILHSATLKIRAKCIVNAAGPWVDEVRKLDGKINGKRLHLTKGVHIVVSHNRFPIQQAAYFDTSDGRMIFAIPRDGKTYIGTTDTNFKSEKLHPRITKEDVTYLLNATNRLFPSVNLKEGDIESTWSGLRPLIHEDGKDPSELSRKDELFIADTGLISIAGGKLTGYRVMAKKVIDKVIQHIDPNGNAGFAACQTKETILNGGAFDSEQDIVNFKHQLFGESKQIGARFQQVSLWVDRYGRDAEKVMELAYELWPSIEEKQWAPDIAEMKYAIENEMCVHPSDYFIRRTSSLYFHRPELLQKYSSLYPVYAQMLSYTDEQKTEYNYEFLREVDETLDFTENSN